MENLYLPAKLDINFTMISWFLKTEIIQKVLLSNSFPIKLPQHFYKTWMDGAGVERLLSRWQQRWTFSSQILKFFFPLWILTCQLRDEK